MRRLKLVPEETHYDFFKYRTITFGISAVAVVASIILWLTMGLNFGIDFRGGSTIRTQSEQPVDVAAYRQAISPLGLGDIVITEVFGTSDHVASIRIQSQNDQDSVSSATIDKVEKALQGVDSSIKFTSVESVGPKVSGELIQTAFLAVGASLAAILLYIWLRFEWQFALGAVIALFHDVLVTIGIFALFQIKFDLTVIAALLTIIGYSINDTVVIFDRLRENLRKYKTKPLIDVMNLSVNETLSRTLMTSGTTLIALIALLVLGGDVIRGFVFAITWGVVVGTYSSVYVAKNIVLWLGVKRDWTKKSNGGKGNQFANIDA
ncbi:protein translocase subunit SecF [Pseudooceanicola sp. CBS1P-1]|uniref:Protein-export membrane protein SecF n=1 Tax=Pseudooceanicola albus TaxID=2692189 RepID=A0A6L7FZV1_9RHOB|nr:MULTISPECIES: protein translocase subunit SecF [Pseudooceanicola]MBT9382277.1 protein translocase subunit SecF [Pseudooceanicola endophyticus]MXN16820.1 protein translocase subunit SecF [Pseudooceanicola albus]